VGWTGWAKSICPGVQGPPSSGHKNNFPVTAKIRTSGYQTLDGTTLLPRARSKPTAWDVTVPDTYAGSHIDQTAREACSAANKATANKIVKCGTLSAWNQSAIELIQEIGRRITAVTEDTRETVFPFQRLSTSWLHSTPCDTL